ncbi:MAG TPA: 16S rRNA (cytosine(967)-C(5))-methyltransferase RsmB [Nevskiaceae bacterium]|nr:16S rRNA (cytosine(967)-C(5))-methyltransferase RsmB [Nevskiaceae bacterium]
MEAARAVARVLAGRNLDDALGAAASFSGPDAAFAKAMAYGVVRDHALLSALAAKMLQKPIDRDTDLHSLLLCGLYQLRSMRVPPHAAVSETVGAADAMNKAFAKGMVNAVLRRYLRERDALEAALPSDPAIRYSHPQWLVDRIKNDWPQDWQDVLAADQQPGPMTLRVNRRRSTRDEYLAELRAAGLDASPVEHVPEALRLAEPIGVDKLPGFGDGKVSVQDASAQLAAHLLDLRDGQRVLDACAAPGGKAAHILERADVHLLAIDDDAERLKRVRSTFERLQLKTTWKRADATRPSTWAQGLTFDRILIDAPCSGTGVIRRHPDIKLLRRAEDIAQMAAVQLRLLHMLWPLLQPGGVLVYAVCSVLAEEGAQLVERFLTKQTDAREVAIDSTWGEACAIGRRIAPGGDFDGFYYARLQRST